MVKIAYKKYDRTECFRFNQLREIAKEAIIEKYPAMPDSFIDSIIAEYYD